MLSFTQPAADFSGVVISMVVDMVPVEVGSVAYNPPEGKDYKWYISGIYCQLGDYVPPTTLYGNPKKNIDYIANPNNALRGNPSNLPYN